MKTLRLLGALLLGGASGAAAQANQQLLGTWRLVSLTAEVAGTGEKVATFGDAPEGYLVYGADGRMLVMIVKAQRPRPADTAQLTDSERLELFNTMVAYGGTYRVDGDQVATTPSAPPSTRRWASCASSPR